MLNTAALTVTNPLERRRSKRLLVVLPLVVRFQGAQSKAALEHTSTVDVSAHGALMHLATKVVLGQTLTLMNPDNWDERDVCVSRVGSSDGAMTQAGIDFGRPAPEFWPLAAGPQKAFPQS
jgi:hypothetical protein